MTQDLADIADTLETLAKLCREPKNRVSSSPYRIKRAILASSYFGLHGLQTVLGVASDGILGPITWKALEDINVDVLVTKMLAYIVQHPMPSPVCVPPISPPPVPTLVPVPTPTPTTVPNAAEYAKFFVQMVIDSSRTTEIQSIAHKIQSNISRYKTVADAVGVTYWPLVGIIHNLESSCNFGTHLYNGDPLTHRTIHTPVGHPTTGEPPFTWEFSAIDALRYEGFDRWHDWTIIGMAYMLEKYNGFGYRNHKLPSPYLWAGSSIYTKGFYTSDGVFDPEAVSRQIGGMTMIKYFFDQGIVIS